MDINQLSIWLTVVTSLLAFIGYFTGFFKWLWDKIKNFFHRNQEILLKIPSKTIIVLPENTQLQQATTWWHLGSNAGKPIMQVVGNFIVTNITKGNILLTGAELKKPKIRGMVHVKDVNSQFHGSYAIPPGYTTKMSIDFLIEPPTIQMNKSFFADIAIYDQFGNKHWIKNIEFKYA